MPGGFRTAGAAFLIVLVTIPLNVILYLVGLPFLLLGSAVALVIRQVPLGQPRIGEVYEATGDVKVSFMTGWRAPFTGGGSGILTQGQRIRLGRSGLLSGLLFVAEPLDKVEAERMLVPRDEREHPKYAGFTVTIWLPMVMRHFRRVSEAA